MNVLITVGINERRWKQDIDYIKGLIELMGFETKLCKDTFEIRRKNKKVRVLRVWKENIEKIRYEGEKEHYHIGWCAALNKNYKTNMLVTPVQARKCEVKNNKLLLYPTTQKIKQNLTIYEKIINKKMPEQLREKLEKILETNLPKQKIHGVKFVSGNIILNKEENTKINQVIEGNKTIGNNAIQTLKEITDCYDMEVYYLLKSKPKSKIFIWVLDNIVRDQDLSHKDRKSQALTETFIKNYKRYSLYFLLKIIYYYLTEE